MAKKKKKKVKSGKIKVSFKGFILLLCVVVSMILFLPSTFLVVIGMLPTFAAALIDKDPAKNKTFTIGAMNFAGCFPYLMGLWTVSNTMEKAMDYIANSETIIVMYGAAALGYLINWLITMGVASLIIKKSKMRIKKIEDEKEALEKRWGKEVNGQYTLDEHGFPLDPDSSKKEDLEATS